MILTYYVALPVLFITVACVMHEWVRGNVKIKRGKCQRSVSSIKRYLPDVKVLVVKCNTGIVLQ